MSANVMLDHHKLLELPMNVNCLDAVLRAASFEVVWRVLNVIFYNLIMLIFYTRLPAVKSYFSYLYCDVSPESRDIGAHIVP
jgi:hypothetical protein